MAKTKVGIKEFDSSVIPYFLKFQQAHYWVDYDEETDTLYISFRKPQSANDSVMKGNFIYHYDNDRLVGVTVLHAKG
ncbi:hypothetical protein AUJ66_04105 [Candidatus Desantisbacteria bacterium CG1_02_38_46]|uniref:DUF2283 domain-containing protein n=2 Tax=unclassified Candidatus Desantisiibacteriota TaxID=3106372 RepID=A0A1J4SCS2_9BACT|nr:MAG: hypothetical protein AUJ66_04105 [Candidatus Desantisbacteria bacterium CG1_02_38_46]PIU50746.1 MAG: hypothetical protein COS91_08070 [Candidatus Desantisbacteria bacterium CG07_land_8_20_14_0_80_39_15]